MTSCVCWKIRLTVLAMVISVEKDTCDTPFAVRILLGEIKRNREDVYVGK